MPFDIAHESSLILNFFSGKVYFIFDNEKEVESFLSFVKFYDNRFNEDFHGKSIMKSAAWEYRNLTHRHQLEWSDNTNDFKKLDMHPVSYSVVMRYVEQYNTMAKCFSGLMSAFWGDKESKKEE